MNWWIVLAVVLLLLCLAEHEWMHAKAMQARGIRVVEAGLGLPMPPFLTITRRRPDAQPRLFRLSPWLIGAYVKPEEEDEGLLDALPYRDYAWIMGSGIVANLTTGSLLVTFGEILSQQGPKALGWAIAATLIHLFDRIVARYVLPVLGVATLGLVAWSFTDTLGHPQGLVGMAQFIGPLHSLAQVLIQVGAAVVCLGVANALPVYPLDGGKIAHKLFSRLGIPGRAMKIYEVAGSVVVLALVGYGMVSDVLFG